VRQLTVFVHRDLGQRTLEIAGRHGGVNLACVDAREPDRQTALVLIHLENHAVDALLAELQSLDTTLRVTLAPSGVVALWPPEAEAPEQVADVSNRSPLEVFVSGLQSVGSWYGFLGYAASAAVVAWVGLHTNTVFLLTAAMLIAPFAGPAMTLALGTARGDATLIGRSLVRYVSSLALTVVIAFVLSWLLRQDIATELMVQNSLVSSFAVFLPLTAGAAGALNLCQSERNSLVTAAGPGMLVAASLAPPAAMIGMAGAIGEWGMVANGLFVLLLQLVGINLSGAAVFRLFGLKPRGVRYERGRSSLRTASVAVTLAGLCALLFWQFKSRPDVQRSTRAQRISHLVQQTLKDGGQVHPAQVEVHFTRGDIPGQRTALVRVYGQRREGVQTAKSELERALSASLRQRILDEGFQVTPLVDVTVLDPPPR
jgi:uncharacterized hydrophobic protein (TIGR00271 family)